jgi:hypothetical protein
MSKYPTKAASLPSIKLSKKVIGCKFDCTIFTRPLPLIEKLDLFGKYSLNTPLVLGANSKKSLVILIVASLVHAKG